MKFKITRILKKCEDQIDKMTKALSVVCNEPFLSTIDRGLQFLRNWFKNKVPHHQASQL